MQNGSSISGEFFVSGNSTPAGFSGSINGGYSSDPYVIIYSEQNGKALEFVSSSVSGGFMEGQYYVNNSIGSSQNWIANRLGAFGPPQIKEAGIVPVYSNLTSIQPGEWVSIYGTNLASSTATWSGNFPTSLGGTSVTINGRAAYLWFVSPAQINLQTPDDSATGSVPVVVTTASGEGTSSVTLAQSAPSFMLLDSKHVAGIILRSNGSGAYSGGAYDIIGPTGDSLGYATVAAKAGDEVELFAVGLGPTNPVVTAGKSFSGAAPTTYSVNILINKVDVIPTFAGLSSAGLYQINLIVPSGLGAGDISLVATVEGEQTPPTVVISLQ